MPLDLETIARAAKLNIDRVPKDGLNVLEGLRRNYRVLFDHLRGFMARVDMELVIEAPPGTASIDLVSIQQDILLLVDTAGQSGSRSITLPTGFDYQRILVKDVGTNADNQTLDVGGITTIASAGGSVELLYRNDAWEVLR